LPGGSAQTLRDYWSGHGHAGPSHGAERDAIAWGTPGDFDRCVAQVTAHGKMTPEEAKGYCNLRHHDALGYYPATHARMDRGKMAVAEIQFADQAFERVKSALFKAQGSGAQADGGGEARVPSGSGVTSGQWTTGSDGPTKNPPKPNPYANGQKKPAAKPKPDAHQQHMQHLQNEGAGARAQQTAQLNGQLKQLDSQLSSLEAEKQKLTATGVSSFGTSSTVSSPSSSSSTSGSSSTGSTSSTSSTSSTGSSSSGSSSSTSSSSTSAQLAQVNAQIAQVHQQIAQVKSQLQALAQAGQSGKSVKNPRDVESGRFRTFQGEVAEAKQALAEGRHADAVELLGSARALAQDPGQRLVVGNLQSALARVQHGTIVPQLVKLLDYRSR